MEAYKEAHAYLPLSFEIHFLINFRKGFAFPYSYSIFHMDKHYFSRDLPFIRRGGYTASTRDVEIQCSVEWSKQNKLKLLIVLVSLHFYGKKTLLYSGGGGGCQGILFILI